MGLRSFENGLERMVEGVFSRAFRSAVRPIELGRRMLREMDERRSIDVQGRRIAPNAFVFRLSPSDHTTFADIHTALVDELVAAATEYANDEGYFLLGPVTVDIVVDEALPTGRFDITSSRRDTSLPGSAPAAPAPAPAAPAAIPGAMAGSSIEPLEPSLSASVFSPGAAAAVAAPETSTPLDRGSVLVLPSGDRVTLGIAPVTIGRNPDCTVVISDPSVSRRHAEVKPLPVGWTITDLGSTNGTRVNGVKVDGERLLHEGDVITIGSKTLRYEAS